MPTLLVVDDEQSILSFVSKAMVRRGWTVVVVDTVDDALKATREQSIDIALCDVVMPKSGGAEFARVMRATASSIPVVLMTGHPSAELFADGDLPSWWHPLPLLEKPFTSTELETALVAALEDRVHRHHDHLLGLAGESEDPALH